MDRFTVLAFIAVAGLAAISCAGAPDAGPPASTGIAASPQQGPKGPAQPVLPSQSGELLVEADASAFNTTAIVDKQVNLEIVLDASGSMREDFGGRPRLDVAREALSALLDRLPAQVNVALRVYGHRYSDADQARSCQDVELLAPLAPAAPHRLEKELTAVQARGWTALARSLELAAADLPNARDNLNSVVLVTDGEETCGGDPLSVATAIKQGPSAVTVHVIGLALNDAARDQLRSVAEATGGLYRDAADSAGLLAAVQEALTAARGRSALRVEVLGEGDRQVSVGIELREAGRHNVAQRFPAWIDAPVPPGTYDLVVGTAPRTIYRGVTLGDHTQAVLRVRTGAMRVELVGPTGTRLDAPVDLFVHKTPTPVRSFPTWYNQPVLPGRYDIVVNSAPRVVKNGVEVSAGRPTVLQLGHARLRVEVAAPSGTLPDATVELRDPETGEVLRAISSASDQVVAAGTYDLALRGAPGFPLRGLQIRPGEMKTVRVSGAPVRVEHAEGGARHSVVPVQVLDPANGKVLGEFRTWEERFIVEGTYQVRILGQQELLLPLDVRAGRGPIVLSTTP